MAVAMVEFENVSFWYCRNTPYEHRALCDISFAIERGEFLGIVGANGSGKTTLVQLVNGLMSPAAGEVRVFGKSTADRAHREGLWKRVGLLFQYPEKQLFEATVFDDAAYGVRNMGVNPDEVRERVRHALAAVGLDPDESGGLAPLALSGGQRRRAAIAGVLAMQPELLILDEPTAGLDGPGRTAILQLIKRLQTEEKLTVLMISHSSREVIGLADRIAVLADGRLARLGPVRDVIREAAQSGEMAGERAEELAGELRKEAAGECREGATGEWRKEAAGKCQEEAEGEHPGRSVTRTGLILPEFVQVLQRLRERGIPVEPDALTREEALEQLRLLAKERSHEQTEAGAVR